MVVSYTYRYMAISNPYNPERDTPIIAPYVVLGQGA